MSNQLAKRIASVETARGQTKSGYWVIEVPGDIEAPDKETALATLCVARGKSLPEPGNLIVLMWVPPHRPRPAWDDEEGIDLDALKRVYTELTAA